MMIVRQDTNGTKPLLQVGELGYDNFPAGGDRGRVYVGTGSENLPLAKKAEMLAVEGKADVHIAREDNPHGVTKAQVGLGNVDNTSDADKPISTATQDALNTKVDKKKDVSGDIDLVLTGGIYAYSTALTNLPAGAGMAGTLIVSQGINTSAISQLLISINGNMFFRYGDNNGWYSWEQVATETELNSKDAQNVKLTGNQTIAGAKTFSSSPIVPTPTTDFQATTARSTNITVNVGAGQTYTTINQALEYLSGFYPLYKTTGVTATINLKAGFVMNEQVLVSGLNLGWITIVGEDAETIITHTALTTSFYGNHYPAFGVDKGGTSPIIGQLFRFNVEKVGGNKHGIMAYGTGSSANINAGAGFIGAGTNGIFAVDCSIINANGANASSAGGYGIFAYNSSTINAGGANASNAGGYGIFAAASSTINANGANASNTKNTGIFAYNSSTINADGADVSNAVTYGILAAASSTINANGANASSAGTNGIVAIYGSTINANSAILQNQTTGGSGILVMYGSTIEASGISTTGGTVPVLSQTANTLTGNGIIYQ